MILRSHIEWTEDTRDENQPPSFVECHKDRLPATIISALSNLKMMPRFLKEKLQQYIEVNHYF